jgi:hypothetical protein
MQATLRRRKRISRDAKEDLHAIDASPYPWGTANSRIAFAVQEINRARGNARAAYNRHDDVTVRSELKTIVTLAKRIMIISENMPL